MITYFYKILDENKKIIYVGVTTRKVTLRFQEHLKNKNLNNRCSIVVFDKINHPDIISINVFQQEYEKVLNLEQKYINEEKRKGSSLLNISPGGEWGAHILNKLLKKEFFEKYGTYENYVVYHKNVISIKAWLKTWIRIRSENEIKIWLNNWILHRKTNPTKQWLQNWITSQSKPLIKSWLQSWIRHKVESKIKIWLIYWCNSNDNKVRTWLHHWILHKSSNAVKVWLCHWISHKKENKVKGWLQQWIGTKGTSSVKTWLNNWVLHKSENRVKVWLNNWINHKEKKN